MHKKKFSYALVISALAISVVFISRTNVTAISFEFLNENIWQWSYDDLQDNLGTIANAIDPVNWPNQVDTDLEEEDGHELPMSFLTTPLLILKSGRNSYVFYGDDVPTSWADLDYYGIDSISSYAPVPEPATVLLIGTGLAVLVGFSRKKFKKM